MTTTELHKSGTPLWSAVLGVTSIVGSYGLACVFPFAALAALAAVTLSARRAAALVGAVWLANQIVGFTLLGYPRDAQALTWGFVIGAAAFAALGAARFAFGTQVRLLSLRTILALAASIAAYQAIMFVAASALDGFASSTPAIVGTVVRDDALWFVALVALRMVLAHGLPHRFGAMRTAPALV